MLIKKGAFKSPLFLIILIGFFLYLKVIFFDFVWDDKALVINNPLIRPPLRLKEIFTTTIFYPKVLKTPFWRPLQTLSYFLDYKIAGLNSKIFHLTNIILHVLNSILVFLIIQNIFSKKFISFFTSIFFLIHPLNLESVCYVSGRADLLMGFFILTAFYFFLFYQNTDRLLFLFFSLIFFSLALLSKESSLIFPIWIFLYLKFIKKDVFKKAFKKAIFFFLISFFYLILRIFVLKIPSSITFQKFYPPLVRFLTLPQVFFQYLIVLFFPIRLHMARNVIVFEKFCFFLLFQWLIMLFIFLFLFKISQKSFYAKFSLTFFFTFLFPNLPPFPQNAFLAEHFLYLAQIGIWVMLSVFLYSKKLRSILFFYLLFIFFINFKTSDYWKDNKVLYERILKLSPNSFAVCNNLGTVYLEEGDFKKADFLFKRALKINPGFLEAKLNLARIYYLKGDLEKAISMTKKIIKSEPSYYLAYQYLGAFYAKKKDFERAEKAFKKALKLNPKNPLIWYDLYLFYKEKGDIKNAYSALKKAGSLNKDYLGEFYFLKSKEFLEKGNFKKALNYVNKALRINRLNCEYFNLKGVIFKNMGRFKEAVIFYKKALRLNPKNPQVYNNLGVLFGLLKRDKEAEFYFKKSLEFDKDNFEANMNLGFFYLKKGEKAKARYYFLKAKRINPQYFSKFKDYLKDNSIIDVDF